MKHIKKVITLLLAAMMVLAMSASVFADEPTPKSITLSGGKAGHTYTLYQIFTGTYDDTSKELQNIQWGSDVTDTKKGTGTAAAEAKRIATADDARATAQEYISEGWLKESTKKVVLTDDGQVKFEGLADGYYMIVDTNGNTTPVEGDYSSAYIVEVVKDVTGDIKGSGASSDKKVIDPETGNASTTDAVAYNIGDAVPFQLTATTADNVAAYKKYHITFHDTQSEGLDAPTSFTVKVLGKEFTVNSSGTVTPANATTAKGTKITVTKETPASGESFAIKVEFEPTDPNPDDGTPAPTYLDAECNSTVITVDYTATLNDDAEIGLPGNDNTSNITFSNNPESNDGHEEGKTPDDTTVVFTFKTVIDKVDQSGNALTGAGFTLYQEADEDTPNAKLGSELTFATGVKHDDIDADTYYVVRAMTTVDGNGAQFEYEGLADGSYVLVETTVPDGFNPLASKAFTISSVVSEADGEGTITSLVGTDPFELTNAGADGSVAHDVTEHELDSGELYAVIENQSGTQLPSTGGIGTIIFYVLGSLLVVGCGIVLISKRRINANK